MKKMAKTVKRVMSILLCVAMVMTTVDFTAITVKADDDVQVISDNQATISGDEAAELSEDANIVGDTAEGGTVSDDDIAGDSYDVTLDDIDNTAPVDAILSDGYENVGNAPANSILMFNDLTSRDSTNEKKYGGTITYQIFDDNDSPIWDEEKTVDTLSFDTNNSYTLAGIQEDISNASRIEISFTPAQGSAVNFRKGITLSYNGNNLTKQDYDTEDTVIFNFDNTDGATYYEIQFSFVSTSDGGDGGYANGYLYFVDSSFPGCGGDIYYRIDGKVDLTDPSKYTKVEDVNEGINVSGTYDMISFLFVPNAGSALDPEKGLGSVNGYANYTAVDSWSNLLPDIDGTYCIYKPDNQDADYWKNKPFQLYFEFAEGENDTPGTMLVKDKSKSGFSGSVYYCTTDLIEKYSLDPNSDLSAENIAAIVNEGTPIYNNSVIDVSEWTGKVFFIFVPDEGSELEYVNLQQDDSYYSIGDYISDKICIRTWDPSYTGKTWSGTKFTLEYDFNAVDTRFNKEKGTLALECTNYGTGTGSFEYWFGDDEDNKVYVTADKFDELIDVKQNLGENDSPKPLHFRFITTAGNTFYDARGVYLYINGESNCQPLYKTDVDGVYTWDFGFDGEPNNKAYTLTFGFIDNASLCSSSVNVGMTITTNKPEGVVTPSTCVALMLNNGQMAYMNGEQKEYVNRYDFTVDYGNNNDFSEWEDGKTNVIAPATIYYTPDVKYIDEDRAEGEEEYAFGTFALSFDVGMRPTSIKVNGHEMLYDYPDNNILLQRIEADGPNTRYVFSWENVWLVDGQIDEYGNEGFTRDINIEVVQEAMPAEEMPIGFFWFENHIADTDQPDNPREWFLEHGKIELVSIEYDGYTYDDDNLPQYNYHGDNYISWYIEDEEHCQVVAPLGAVMTVRVVPDYGYQLTGFSARGAYLESNPENMCEYTFEVEPGMYALGVDFTATDDVLDADGTDTFSGGSVTLAEGQGDTDIGNGVAMVTVEDNDDISEPQDEGFVAAFVEGLEDGQSEADIHYEVFEIGLSERVDQYGTEDGFWSKPVETEDGQLSDYVNVTLSVEESYANIESATIVHEVPIKWDTDGNPTEYDYQMIAAEVDSENMTISFNTNSFSNFAIMIEGTPASKAEFTSFKIDSSKETLYLPACGVPNEDGYYFDEATGTKYYFDANYEKYSEGEGEYYTGGTSAATFITFTATGTITNDDGATETVKISPEDIDWTITSNTAGLEICVEDDGVVIHGCKTGTATVTATATFNGKEITSTCTVTVKKGSIDVLQERWVALIDEETGKIMLDEDGEEIWYPDGSFIVRNSFADLTGAQKWIYGTWDHQCDDDYEAWEKDKNPEKGDFDFQPSTYIVKLYSNVTVSDTGVFNYAWIHSGDEGNADPYYCDDRVMFDFGGYTVTLSKNLTLRNGAKFVNGTLKANQGIAILDGDVFFGDAFSYENEGETIHGADEFTVSTSTLTIGEGSNVHVTGSLTATGKTSIGAGTNIYDNGSVTLAAVYVSTSDEFEDKDEEGNGHINIVRFFGDEENLGATIIINGEFTSDDNTFLHFGLASAKFEGDTPIWDIVDKNKEGEEVVVKKGVIMEIDQDYALFTTNQKSVPSFVQLAQPDGVNNGYWNIYINGGVAYAGRDKYSIWNETTGYGASFSQWDDAADAVAAINDPNADITLTIFEEENYAGSNFKLPKSAAHFTVRSEVFSTYVDEDGKISYVQEVDEEGKPKYDDKGNPIYHIVPVDILYTGKITLTCDTTFENIQFIMVDTNGEEVSPYSVSDVDIAGHELLARGVLSFNTPVNFTDSKKTGTLAADWETKFVTGVTSSETDMMNYTMIRDSYGDFDEFSSKIIIAGSVTNVGTVRVEGGQVLVMTDYVTKSGTTYKFNAPGFTPVNLEANGGYVYILTDNADHIDEVCDSIFNENLADKEVICTAGKSFTGVATATITNTYIRDGSVVNAQALKLTNVTMDGGTLTSMSDYTISGTFTSLNSGNLLLTTRNASKSDAPFLTISGTVILQDEFCQVNVGVIDAAGNYVPFSGEEDGDSILLNTKNGNIDQFVPAFIVEADEQGKIKYDDDGHVSNRRTNIPAVCWAELDENGNVVSAKQYDDNGFVHDYDGWGPCQFSGENTEGYFLKKDKAGNIVLLTGDQVAVALAVVDYERDENGNILYFATDENGDFIYENGNKVVDPNGTPALFPSYNWEEENGTKHSALELPYENLIGYYQTWADAVVTINNLKNQDAVYEIIVVHDIEPDKISFPTATCISQLYVTGLKDDEGNYKKLCFTNGLTLTSKTEFYEVALAPVKLVNKNASVTLDNGTKVNATDKGYIGTSLSLNTSGYDLNLICVDMAKVGDDILGDGKGIQCTFDFLTGNDKNTVFISQCTKDRNSDEGITFSKGISKIGKLIVDTDILVVSGNVSAKELIILNDDNRDIGINIEKGNISSTDIINGGYIDISSGNITATTINPLKADDGNYVHGWIWVSTGNVSLKNGNINEMDINKGTLTVSESVYCDGYIYVNGKVTAKDITLKKKGDETGILICEDVVSIIGTLTMIGGAELDTSENAGKAVTIKDINLCDAAGNPTVGNTITYSRVAQKNNENGVSNLKITGTIITDSNNPLILHESNVDDSGYAAELNALGADKNYQVKPADANLIANIGNIPSGLISFKQGNHDLDAKYALVKYNKGLYYADITKAPFNNSVVAMIEFQGNVPAGASEFLDWNEAIKEINNNNDVTKNYAIMLLPHYKADDDKILKDTVITDVNKHGALTLPGVNKCTALIVTKATINAPNNIEGQVSIQYTGNISGYGLIELEEVQLMTVKSATSDEAGTTNITVNKNTAKNANAEYRFSASFVDYGEDDPIPSLMSGGATLGFYKGGALELSNAIVKTTTASTFTSLFLDGEAVYDSAAQTTVTDVLVNSNKSYIAVKQNAQGNPQFTINGQATPEGANVKLNIKLLDKTGTEITGADNLSGVRLVLAPKANADNIRAYELKDQNDIVSYRDANKYILNGDRSKMLIKVDKSEKINGVLVDGIFTYAESWNDAIKAIDNAGNKDATYTITFVKENVPENVENRLLIATSTADPTTWFNPDGNDKDAPKLTMPKATSAKRINIQLSCINEQTHNMNIIEGLTFVFSGNLSCTTDVSLTGTFSSTQKVGDKYYLTNNFGANVPKNTGLGLTSAVSDGDNLILTSVTGGGTSAFGSLHNVHVLGDVKLDTLGVATVRDISTEIDGELAVNTIIVYNSHTIISHGKVTINDIVGKANPTQEHVLTLQYSFSDATKSAAGATRLTINGSITNCTLNLAPQILNVAQLPENATDEQKAAYFANLTNVLDVTNQGTSTKRLEYKDATGVWVNQKLATMGKAQIGTDAQIFVTIKGGMDVNENTYYLYKENQGLYLTSETPTIRLIGSAGDGYTYDGWFIDWDQMVAEANRIGSTKEGDPNSILTIKLYDNVGLLNAPIAKLDLPSKTTDLNIISSNPETKLIYTTATTVTLKSETWISNVGIVSRKYDSKTKQYGTGTYSISGGKYGLHADNFYTYDQVSLIKDVTVATLDVDSGEFWVAGKITVTDMNVVAGAKVYASTSGNSNVTVSKTLDNAGTILVGNGGTLTATNLETDAGSSLQAADVTVKTNAYLGGGTIKAGTKSNTKDGKVTLNNVMVLVNNGVTPTTISSKKAADTTKAPGNNQLTITGTISFRDKATGEEVPFTDVSYHNDGNGPIVVEVRDNRTINNTAVNTSAIAWDGETLLLATAKNASDSWFRPALSMNGGNAYNYDDAHIYKSGSSIMLSTGIYAEVCLTQYETVMPADAKGKAYDYNGDGVIDTKDAIDAGNNGEDAGQSVKIISEFETFEDAVKEIDNLSKYKLLDNGKNSTYFEDYEIALLDDVEITNANGEYATLTLPQKVGTLTISSYDFSNKDLKFTGAFTLKSNTVIEDVTLEAWKTVKGVDEETKVPFNLGAYTLTLDRAIVTCASTITGTAKTSALIIKSDFNGDSAKVLAEGNVNLNSLVFDTEDFDDVEGNYKNANREKFRVAYTRDNMQAYRTEIRKTNNEDLTDDEQAEFDNRMRKALNDMGLWDFIKYVNEDAYRNECFEEFLDQRDIENFDDLSDDKKGELTEEFDLLAEYMINRKVDDEMSEVNDDILNSSALFEVNGNMTINNITVKGGGQAVIGVDRSKNLAINGTVTADVKPVMFMIQGESDGLPFGTKILSGKNLYNNGTYPIALLVLYREYDEAINYNVPVMIIFASYVEKGVIKSGSRRETFIRANNLD